MKLHLSTAALLAATLATAQKIGINMGANNPKTGACNTQADWERSFRTIKSWSPGFNSVRLFSTSDCNTLANAVPAARNTGMKLLVGVWASQDKVRLEKQALISAITTYPDTEKWLDAISVGSEDLYRTPKMDPNYLANEINDVRAQVLARGKAVLVGHTDTWTAWVDRSNDVVTKAVDVVITNGFPYWQGATPDASRGVFTDSVRNTKNVVRSVKANVPIWVGETGWPTGGDNFGASAPNTANLQSYWKGTGCALMKGQIEGINDFYWFSAFNADMASADRGGVEKYFGIADSSERLKIDLSC